MAEPSSPPIDAPLDDVLPARDDRGLPVVGLGGSAGSIPALRSFFDHAPAKAGFAYVVVLHLDPGHDSSLAEILQRHTAMPVRTARDAGPVEPDTVYVIPPGKHLTAADGHLRLTELQPAHGRRVAVDLFFRSLAQTHGPQATAVVLSGADGDGAIGLKQIKERGGLTIAQDPQEAHHAGMPSSAIDTGMVDWVLPAAEMAARIVEYHSSAARLTLPAEDPASAPKADDLQGAPRRGQLSDVLAQLRARTGRDFSYYKRATIVRRLSRRMQVNGLDQLADYLELLRTQPGEAAALQQDLLISVTQFFRDRDTFAALDKRIPELFVGKGAEDAIRIWVPACATGEEAYSFAMLLLEHAQRIDSPPALQVFGCDLDETAIQVARAGLYPETIVADVSEERLGRFFTKEAGAYRVRRELREMVLFAAHDLLKDAPFSRMDLVSCRNLLIYLERDAQARALEVFHFALRPGGLLVLGSSESVDDGSALFAAVDKKRRIYAHRLVRRARLAVPTGASVVERMIGQHAQARGTTGLPGREPAAGGGAAATPIAGVFERAPSASELHGRLVARFGPPSILVGADHEVLHVSENANRFLQFPEGEPTRNLMRLVHPMLRIDLRAALLRAQEYGEPVDVFRRRVELDGGARSVDIRVAPAGGLAPGCLLVLFDSHDAGPAGTNETAAIEPAAVVEQLERELTRANANLRGTVEQYEASTEELKASNEELQAMNEELRSAGEELETSREELQSVNEELSTVNAELKMRVDELGRANSDLHNLMNATQIATVFLDRDLHITRYTPSAVRLFNLIPGDVGRPIAHLNTRLDYAELTSDAEHVLRTLVPIEREMRDDGHWFMARVLPYRTHDDRIAGVVLTFVDISDRRRAELALRESEERQRFLLVLGDAMRAQSNSAGVIAAATRLLGERLQASRIVYAEIDDGAGVARIREGWAAADATMHPAELRLADFSGPLLDQLRAGGTVRFDDVASPDGTQRADLAALEAIGVRAGVSVPLLIGGRLVMNLNVHQHGPRAWTDAEVRLIEEVAERSWAAAERVRVEEALRDSEEKYRTLFNSMDEGYCIIQMLADAAGRPVDWRFLEVNPAFEKHNGLRDATGRTIRELAPDIEPKWASIYGRVAETGESLRFEESSAVLGRSFDLYAFRVGEPGEGKVAVLFTDVSERVRAEEALRDSEARLRQFGQASSDILWIRDAQTLRFEYVSPAFEAVHGVDAEAGVDDDLRGWAERVHPDDRQHALEQIGRVRDGERVTFEYRIVRADDGEVRWIRDIDFPLRDAAGKVHRIGGIGHDATEEKASADRMRVMIAELQHRTRNLIAVVRSIAQQTMTVTGPSDEFQSRFFERLAALSRVQGVLSRADETPITLETLIRNELDALGASAGDDEQGRVRLSGPPVRIRNAMVQTLSLALHELATNARKYGALGDGAGRLEVSWSIYEPPADDRRLLLEWREQMPGGGALPGGAGAERVGYGRQLIEKALPYSLGAKTTYELHPDGVRCTIDLPLDRHAGGRER